MNLQNLPKNLVNEITSNHWQPTFTPTKRTKGQILAHQNKVILEDIEIDPEFPEDYHLDFNVIGTQLYKTTISLIDNTLSGDCNCPDADYNTCKHQAAALFHLQKLLSPEQTTPETTPSKNIDQWINSLTTDKTPPPSATFAPNFRDRLIYHFAPCEYTRTYKLTPRKATLLTDGSYRLQSTTIKQNLTENTKPKYITSQDLPILHRLEQNSSSYHTTTVPEESSLLGDLLLSCAKTGKLTYFTPESNCLSYDHLPPLTLAEPRPLEPIWTPSKNNTLKPALKLTPPAGHIIESAQKIFIDKTQNTIGPITQTHTDTFLKNWGNGPSINSDQLESVTKKLSKITLPNPQKTPSKNPHTPTFPKPPTNKTLKKSTPKPHLTITRKDTTAPTHLFLDTKIADIIIGIPSFIYHHHGLPAHPYKKEQTITTDSEILTIPRNKTAETKHKKTLSQLNLTTLTENHPPSTIAEKYHHALHLSSDPAQNKTLWITFIATQVPALQKQGWKITIDDNLDYSLIPYENHYEDLQTSEAQADWFRFDLGIEHQGKKISLIPALALALSSNAYQDLDLTDPDLLIPIPIDEQNTYISFPATRFKTILDKVADLFNHINQDGNIEIPTLRAATLADDLNLAAQNKTLTDLEQLGKNLKNINGLPATKPPKNLKANLRDYQLTGYRWLQFLAQHKLHGILADDMGLGKTIQTLAHILTEKNNRRNNRLPTLVIAPTSVIPNWISEAQKFTPSLKTLLLHGPDRHQHLPEIPKHDLIITSYALLQRDIKTHQKQPYHLAILDESQYIKNANAKTTRAAGKLQANHRLCLSGTPMENHLGELWSTMNFLMPGLLQNKDTFNKTFRHPIEKDHSETARTSLIRRVAPLILRRTKDVVAKELPSKTTIPHHITLLPEQIDLYESIRASMDKRIRHAIADKGLAKSQILILDALLKLRQICCHPQLLKTPEAQKITTSAKLTYLTELLTTLLEEKRSILIFSQFTTMLTLIEKHLKSQNIPFVKITGATRDRKTPVEQFQTGKIPIFLISLKAGGTGLNLTAADTVIHYDPWWNPAAENQATDRAYRIGQKKPVFVHKLICQGTIEQQIQTLQEKKAALVESLLSASTNKLKIDQTTLTNLLAPL